MKKLLKSVTLMFALILTHSLTFAAVKAPEVYVSESAVSNLSGPQLLQTTWFWVLVLVCVVAFVVAILASKDENHADYFPEHII